MHEVVLLAERRAQPRAPAQDVGRLDMLQVGEVLLRLDDGVEVAAIGDVDDELAQALHLGLDSRGMEEGRHVGDAHAVDIGAVLDVARPRPARPACRGAAAPGSRGVTSPCSSAIVTVPMVPWPHIGRQPEVSMNRMAMSQSAPRRRVEDRARHHVVAARLEHQAGADPVVLGEEMRPLLHHRAAVERGPPPATRRTGLPQVWPSMQKNV